MHKLTKQLLRIQNLELAVRESDVIHRHLNGSPVRSGLKEKVEELKKKVRHDIIANYDRLGSRYEIRVSPMMRETCTGCFMKLPKADALEVMKGNSTYNCPNCGRFLYFEEPAEMSGDYAKCTGIARFSAPELMMPNLKVKDKNDAIKTVAKNTAKAGFVNDEKEFVNALLEREELFSTAMGMGIAIPHARGSFAPGLTFATATIPDGVDFGDGEMVSLMFVFAVPTQVNMFYLEVVSKLAKYFEKEENLQKTVECPDAAEMWKILVRIGR